MPNLSVLCVRDLHRFLARHGKSVSASRDPVLLTVMNIHADSSLPFQVNVDEDVRRSSHLAAVEIPVMIPGQPRTAHLCLVVYTIHNYAGGLPHVTFIGKANMNERDQWIFEHWYKLNLPMAS